MKDWPAWGPRHRHSLKAAEGVIIPLGINAYGSRVLAGDMHTGRCAKVKVSTLDGEQDEDGDGRPRWGDFAEQLTNSLYCGNRHCGVLKASCPNL